MSLETAYKESKESNSLESIKDELSDLKTDINSGSELSENSNDKFIVKYEEQNRIDVPISVIGEAKQNIDKYDIVKKHINDSLKLPERVILYQFISKEKIALLIKHYIDSLTSPNFDPSKEFDYLMKIYLEEKANLSKVQKTLIKEARALVSPKDIHLYIKSMVYDVGFLVREIIFDSIISTKKIFKEYILPRENSKTGEKNIKDYPPNYKGPNKYVVTEADDFVLMRYLYVKPNLDKLFKYFNSPEQLKKIEEVLI